MECKDKIISDLRLKLYELLPTEHIETVCGLVSITLGGYDLALKETAVVTYDYGDADLLRRFFVNKAIEGLTERSLTYYRAVLHKAFLEIGKHIKDITTDDIRVYLAKHKLAGNSDKTLNNIRRVFSSFWGWCVREELLKSNIVLKINRIKEKKIVREAFSEDELETLRTAAKCLRDKAIIEFLYSTGCRVSEATNLNRGDIDFENGEVTVFGKGRKERVVYLTARCRAVLAEYMKSRTDNHDALFISDFSDMRGGANKWIAMRGIRRFDKNSLGRMLRKLGERTGIANVHAHRFRRTAATLALRRGMPIEQVAKMLGHESLNTTTIYANSSQDDIKLAHEKFII